MVCDTKAEGNALPLRERVRRTVGAGASEAFAARGATSLVCVSEAVASEAHRYYRVRADAVIPNGVDTDIFAPRETAPARNRLELPEDGHYALFVGRLQRRKGADLIAAATRRAGYELLIAGATGLPGARHLGILAPDELVDAYAAADCVVFPSRYEACSLVVLEALACGRPLITTRVGWMRTLLDNVPEYDRLCVNPTTDDVHARLRSLADLDTEPLTSSARAFVLRNNSLEHWSKAWRELLEATGNSNLRTTALRPATPCRS
jgi:glycosyltransferase involved in cell wall biosynthesis